MLKRFLTGPHKPFFGTHQGPEWRVVIVLLTLFGSTLSVQAQERDSVQVIPGEVRVQALRFNATEIDSPFAKSMLVRSPGDIALEPGLSLSQSLRLLPGIAITDRGHFALGERVLIRGLGWRSAFGVRGIAVLLDGIPLSLPDGQAGLDIVDPVFVRRAELIRGPASTFWGNGSGGVLSLSTDAFRDSTFVSARAMGGSYGLMQTAAEVAFPVGNHRFHAFASSVSQDGFRDNASGGYDRASLHGAFDLGRKSRLKVMAAMALQDVQSPGSLNQAQVNEDPRQADIRNVNTNAGKESTQIQVGATLYRQTALGLASVTAYGVQRSLENPLNYAYIDLERQAGGLRAQVERTAGRLDMGLGLDAAFQSDDRLNFNNVGGAPGDLLSLDQQENVRNVSAFAVGRFAISDQISASAGLRADGIAFTLEDNLDPSVSGKRDFSAISPSLGVSYVVGRALFFVNYSSAFETPTTTELINQPSGASGLNSSVGAQRTRGYEVGTRGEIAGFEFDMALFHLQVLDRLVPFQDEGGRTYYRNSGENRHRGVELALSRAFNEAFRIHLTYAGSDFVFLDEEGPIGPEIEPEIRNNRIPGIPVHSLQAALSTHSYGVFGQVSARVVSDTFTNSANTAVNEGSVVVDVNVAYTTFHVGGTHIQPFLNVANVFNTTYVGSLVVNAFGGRYFEPSPGRTVQFGVSFSR